MATLSNRDRIGKGLERTSLHPRDALSWAVSHYLFDMAWHPAPGTVAAGVVLTSLVVGLVGVLASLDVVRRRPLAVLRAE